MAIGSFFKLPRHKQFNFKTRYYDADKEEFEERVRRAEQEAKGHESGAYTPNIKGRMQSRLIEQKRSESPYFRIRKIIVVVSVFLLALLFYYLINLFDILATFR